MKSMYAVFLQVRGWLVLVLFLLLGTPVLAGANDWISPQEFYREEGAFLMGDIAIEVFNSPDDSAPVVATYNPGEKVLYDQISYNGDWISYIATNGRRRYVEVKEFRQRGTKTYGIALPDDETLWVDGSFYPNVSIGIRNRAFMSATKVNTYESGEKVNFDQVFTQDGHHWISYVANNGKRRYLPIGKVGEQHLWGELVMAN